ncbi:MAG: DsbC family protein [Pseudohongiella sp.]|nr:DsbC family protein [Pseudohongiella sp.]MDO9520022.1 DsbC family protein [Pseudohongiella sp.]MDP2127185.1 DsbC family protein [Pseudohongiella sp.]
MNRTSFWAMVKAVALMCCAGSSALLNAADAPEWEQSLRDAINTSLGAVTQGQLRVEQVRVTPMEGLYELIMSSGEILLSDRTGQFLITGELYQTQAQGLINLTAQTRQVQVKELIAGMPEDQMIIFSPENPVATITVFTDVDCTYCRRLHHDVEAINARGIAVRYVAYPRGGADSTAYPKMISVWCAPDRKRALTQAKNGQNLPDRDCQNPVLNQHALGNRIGITGTPAIILPDGQLVPGYMEIDRLSQMVLGQ